MSNDVIISVEGLGKRYKIKHQAEQQRYTALRDVIASQFKRLFQTRNSKPETRNSEEDFWALKDVSFEVKQGEVVGIIGRNGAGKSTLLKILSRITEPTTGRVHLKGRVASLLEVGTGFHPELTGRENIFLNGAILGMHRTEIKRKFDEIVAFSEVEKFLDTPVKRYSSGMYVRLAFAVAAHLEPEILIVDEVLAVGDAEFQKKCLGKMGEVARAGRTVILVSHNMPTVQILADKCLLLAGGKVSAFGKTEEVISHYLLSVDSETDCDFSELKRANADYGENVRICAIRPLRSGKLGFRAGEDLSFEVELTVEVPVGGIRFGYSILEVTSAPVMSGFTPPEIQLRGRGRHAFTMTITDPRLAPGNYLFALSVGTGDTRGARHELDVVSPGPGFVVSAISVSGEPVVGWRPEYGRVFHKNCLVHAQTNTQK